MSVNKVIVCNRRPVCSGGQFHDVGSEYEVIGERAIGMLGNQPDPHKFFYHAVYSDADTPSKVYASLIDRWEEVDSLDAARAKSGFNDWKAGQDKQAKAAGKKDAGKK